MLSEGRSSRILVIDDDPSTLRLVNLILGAEGYTNLELLQDSRRSCQCCLAEPPDLILLDLHMPHLDGYEVMAQLQALGDPMLAPILVLTGNAVQDALHRSFASGASDFASKPLNRRELTARVARLLRTQQRRRELHRENTLLQATVRLRANDLLESNTRLQDKVKELQLAEADMRQARERLRELVGHQENVREDERKRIAAEVHDELGSLLTGIKACLSVMGDERDGAAPSRAQVLLDATELADSAMDTVRRVITDLRPSVLDNLGLWSGLEWYASQVAKRTGLQCEVLIADAAQAMDVDAECSTMLFRIVQESLTNVVRHAGATSVSVRAHLCRNDVVIEVQDDGKGIDLGVLHPGRSFGLRGMQERVHYFGGTFRIARAADRGTVVVVRCPIRKSDD